MPRVIAPAIVVLALAGAAAADTAYIEPSSYTPELGETLTVETSFNDFCCMPKYPVRSNRFAVLLPNGKVSDPDRVELFANSTILEHQVLQTGTTRFTTGERLGRKGGEYVLLEGEYVMVNSEDAPAIDVPDGTPVLMSQTATVSDTYVTVGEPTWESVKTVIGRLNIRLLDHPSTLRVGDTLDVIIEFDGYAVTDQDVTLTRSGQKDRPQDEGLVFRSDEHGRLALQLDEIGTHLIMTRMQAPAPEGAETDIRSYTTAITFDVKSR